MQVIQTKRGGAKFYKQKNCQPKGGDLCHRCQNNRGHGRAVVVRKGGKKSRVYVTEEEKRTPPPDAKFPSNFRPPPDIVRSAEGDPFYSVA